MGGFSDERKVKGRAAVVCGYSLALRRRLTESNSRRKFTILPTSARAK